ncbi:MAG: 1-deoxy-D-xylulose-5-phosphate reductoisomerase [Flavobacteriales bacterium]|nr:1-deoxy-D-xylulose-5-phosphate reductoisomerase [Flavobacteriales bacterium]
MKSSKLHSNCQIQYGFYSNYMTGMDIFTNFADLEQKKRNIAILGSTGSIGTQALEVISEQSEILAVSVLTANSNSQLLIEQAKKYQPNTVVIADESKFQEVRDALWDDDIKVFAGIDALSEVVELDEIDFVLTALVGYAGLKPTINAIKAKKQIALANKETLVVAGALITKLAEQNAVNIYPVDSEHSAIFQCLVGEFHNPIEKIYLTASGGPFRGFTKDRLLNVTPTQALKHPNWDMGAKITIDSASLMNKGLEVIEAKWLFGLKAEQIEVVVHPQSIIHSIVQFEDGSMKAQMGLPDMKLPIQYALCYPKRVKNEFKRFNFLDYPELTFESADTETFRNLELAYDALHREGNAACILNAANEVVVDAFLKEKVKFMEMPELIEKSLDKIPFIAEPTYDDYVQTDNETRSLIKELI